MKMKTSRKGSSCSCLAVLEKIFSKVAVGHLGIIHVLTSYIVILRNTYDHFCLELMLTFYYVVIQAQANLNYYRYHIL